MVINWINIIGNNIDSWYFLPRVCATRRLYCDFTYANFAILFYYFILLFYFAYQFNITTSNTNFNTEQMLALYS